MKATIVKNTDFQTIGFEVYQEQTCLFQWGISAQAPGNYIRNYTGLEARELLPTIAKCFELQGRISTLRDFTSNFFEVLRDTDEKEYNGKSFQIKAADDRLERAKKSLESLIKSI